MKTENDIPTSPYQQAATALHGYLVQTHWNGSTLSGPDPGIRFNSRFGRFIKSYSKILPWRDSLTYMQTQGYWIFSNWQLFDLTGNAQAKDIALACSESIVANQLPAGCWEYPNPEWKGRVATVEGCFAALGLLESYARTNDSQLLDAARRWSDYLLTEIGFRHQSDNSMWAINYFAHQKGEHGGGVPNNSTMVLWLLARMYGLTGEAKYIEPCAGMVRWLKHVQLPSGELPYSAGATAELDRTHFLCFQYNAFEFIDLVNYQQLTGDDNIQPVIERLATYLASGLTPQGKARFNCLQDTPDVLYYAVAISKALKLASDLQLGDYRAQADQALRLALAQQKPDGSFTYHSRKNYRCLSDSRSYPRYLSMILHHLLLESQQPDVMNVSTDKLLVTSSKN